MYLAWTDSIHSTEYCWEVWIVHKEFPNAHKLTNPTQLYKYKVWTWEIMASIQRKVCMESFVDRGKFKSHGIAEEDVSNVIVHKSAPVNMHCLQRPASAQRASIGLISGPPLCHPLLRVSNKATAQANDEKFWKTRTKGCILRKHSLTLAITCHANVSNIRYQSTSRNNYCVQKTKRESANRLSELKIYFGIMSFQ